MPWANYSRTCARCGKVGPRVFNPNGPGYIHAYCRTEQEKRVERQRHYAEEKRLRDLQRAPGVTGMDGDRGPCLGGCVWNNGEPCGKCPASRATLAALGVTVCPPAATDHCGYCGGDVPAGSECLSSESAGKCAYYQERCANRKLDACTCGPGDACSRCTSGVEGRRNG